MAVYADGHTFCFTPKCGRTTWPDDNVSQEEGRNITDSKPSQGFRPLPETFAAMTDRRISRETARKFGITVVQDENNFVKYVYPRFDRDGHHVGNKLRGRFKKEFRFEGDKDRMVLFGQQLFPAGSAKTITVTEGQDDAMAVFEMQGSRYPVVSVDSAGSAVKDVANSFEYLNSFENIVLCFDKDEGKVAPDGSITYPGQEAALAVASMFPIGKVRILTLAEHKDANEYLIEGKSSQFTKEWWGAPVYTPSGLKLGKDMWDEIATPKNYETVPYPWATMNEKTYGIRLSELVIVTAETGVGKTSVLKEIEHFILKNTDKGVGFLHLEEPNSDTALGIMSIEANKPLHLPDVRAEVDVDELRRYYDAVINNDRVVVWDHFGSNSIHEVLGKIRHMHNLGCQYIVLDHLSIVVSDQSGDERKQLDEITTKLKTLCMELNIAVIAVIHQNRQGQIRGTAGVEQLANIVMKLYRDKTDPDEWRRNVTKIVIEKNRFCGITGPAAYLFYDPGTGRLVELSKDDAAQYESGSKGEEVWL